MVRLFCTFVIHFIRENFVINNFFPFSTYFLSNMILQCMTTYFSLKKANLVMLSVWIRPNIAANTKNPGVSRNHEKSFYRTNCRVFIITVLNLDCSRSLTTQIYVRLDIFCYTFIFLTSKKTQECPAKLTLVKNH